jgi:hypothetical protein
MRSFLAKMSGGTGFADRAGWRFSSWPQPLRRFKTRLCRRIKTLSQITRIRTECAANDHEWRGEAELAAIRGSFFSFALV